MALHILPRELLDDIFLCLPPPDLAALSRTSRCTQSSAERLLYRHITIDSFSRNLAIVPTLAKRAGVASHVRSFSIRLHKYSLLKSFYHQLRTALSAMTNLASLEVCADSSSSWVLGTSCDVYHRLERFSSSFTLDTHVSHFLTKTPNLLDLQLDFSSLPLPLVPSLPTTALPHLVEFSGPADIVGTIVPGRPIEAIHLTSGDLTTSLVAYLASSTARVVILGASTSSLPAPLLLELGEKMSGVEFLRLMTTYNLDAVADVDMNHRITSALSSFTSLKSFELDGMRWGASLSDSKDGWQSESFGNIELEESLFPGESHLDVIVSF